MNMKYFCHGLTLGTYRKYGYTVFSGLDILKALEDDCVEIGAGQTLMAVMKLLNVGDIISFTNLQGNIIHTALVVDLHNAAQMLTENEIYYEVDLLTKNGVLAECLQSLLVVRGVYSRAPTMRYWRIR